MELYNTTTAVVRAVTTLSNHSHNPLEINYTSQIKTDVMRIAEEVEKLYEAVDEAKTVISNIFHGQVIYNDQQYYDTTGGLKSTASELNKVIEGKYFQIAIALRLVSIEIQGLVVAFQAVDRTYHGDSHNENYRR